MELRAMAEMCDLEDAIWDNNQAAPNESRSSTIKSNEDNIRVGEYVVGAFTDGYYPGEVTTVLGDNITVNFLKPVFF